MNVTVEKTLILTAASPWKLSRYIPAKSEGVSPSQGMFVPSAIGQPLASWGTLPVAGEMADHVVRSIFMASA